MASNGTDKVIAGASLLDNKNLHTAHLHALLTMACLGLVANSVSAAVWFKNVRTKPGTFFLGTLSVADAFFCLVLVYMKSVEIKYYRSCNFVAARGIAFTVSSISRVLTVAVVAQRWMAVARPSYLASMCSLRRQIYTLVGCLLSLLPFIVVETYTDILQCEHWAPQIPSAWFSKWIPISYSIYFARDTITCIGLSVFNILLLYASCTIQKTLGDGGPATWHRSLENRMTVIVTCLSVFTLMEMITFFVYMLLQFQQDKYDDSPLRIIHQWAVVLNSSINVVFYVVFGKEFRAIIWDTYNDMLSVVMRKERKRRKNNRLHIESSNDTLSTDYKL